MATGRPKKVTDPLNDLVIAMLCGDWETSATTIYHNDHYPKSVCLADLVHGFVEEEYQEKISNITVETISHNNILESAGGASNSKIAENESNTSFSISELKDILQGLVSSIHTNGLEALLHKEAARAVDMFKANQNQAQDLKGCRNANDSSDKVNQKSLLKLCVMDRLRGLGYNAGICKSRWEQGNGFTAGDYEYVDVIIDGKERVLVDIDFRVEFVIARPTRQYHALLQILPDIFVGRADRLKQIIKVMCDCAKQSLKKNGMHLPPWRKYQSMYAKWLGSYKRTIKAVPLRREIGKTGWDCGFLRERRGRSLEWEGESEWMPPPVMAGRVCGSGDRGMKVSALASAFNDNGF